jgi:hypothetical protein
VTRLVLEYGCRMAIMQHIAKTDKYLLSTGTPVTDDNGEIFLVVVNERDITELNQLRRKVEQNIEITEKYKEKLADLSLLELQDNEIIPCTFLKTRWNAPAPSIRKKSERPWPGPISTMARA